MRWMNTPGKDLRETRVRLQFEGGRTVDHMISITGGKGEWVGRWKDVPLGTFINDFTPVFFEEVKHLLPNIPHNTTVTVRFGTWERVITVRWWTIFGNTAFLSVSTSFPAWITRVVTYS